MTTFYPLIPLSRLIGLTRLLGVATLLAVLACVLSAQRASAGWENPLPLSPDLDDTSSVALGDLDGDGDLDVVVGNNKDDQRSKVYWNDGTAHFQKSSMEFPDHVAAVAVGDLNGDGALDILFGKAKAAHEVYLNQGSGAFVRANPLPNSAQTTSVAIGDVTHDGWLDIVAGNELTSTILYRNLGFTNGTLAFDAGSPLSSPYTKTKSIALGDLIGNPAPDLVLGNYGQPSVVFKNDGSGNFTFLTSLSQTVPSTLTGYIGTNSIALGDVDGDGRRDIILAGDKQNGPSNSEAADCRNRGATNSPMNGQVYRNVDGVNFWGIFNFTTSGANIKSIALGDINNNGLLDLVAGVASEGKDRTNDRYLLNLRKYDDGVSFGLHALFCQKGFLSDLDYSDADAVALGDLNSDGFLDIVIGNTNKEDMIYLHDHKLTFNSEADTGSAFTGYHPFTPTIPGQVKDIVLGDMNDDRKLDVVALVNNTIIVNQNVSNLIYGGGFGPRVVDWINIAETYKITMPNTLKQIAVGDMDHDGRLDIVAAGSALTLFLNQPQRAVMNFTPRTTLANSGNDTFNRVVLGDINHDTYLDILAGGTAPTITVALNDGKANFTDTVSYSFSATPTLSSMVLGDLNGDGALDLIAAYQAVSTTVYFNDGAGRFLRAFDLPASYGVTTLAVGDINNDGALDIVAANPGHYNLVYFNDDLGRFNNYATLASTSNVTSLALGDLNGDGALDIVAGQLGRHPLDRAKQDSLAYFNDGTGKFSGGEALFYAGDGNALSTAIADLNGDGIPEIIQGTLISRLCRIGDSTCNNQKGTIEIYQTSPEVIDRVNLLPNNPHRLALTRPDKTGNANFYSTSEVITSGKIAIPYTLFDRERDPVGRVELLYSLDGGGKWYTAAATNTITNHLATVPFPTVSSLNPHTFTWDVYQSGFFGQSDNVVLRLKAYPQERTPQPPGTYLYTYTVAGPNQWPYASAMTFPFRVRGTQVRVFGDAAKTIPVAQALVYRLPQGQATGAFLLQSARGPLVTDAQGYLQGRELLAGGDRLIALAPITHSVNYTLYYTSPVYDPANLNSFAPETVQKLGVQALVVSAARPLLLFNLTVSLEWDASEDARFREDLKVDLTHVSQTLYDWSNGQAALGNITIYHNKQQWQEADIRIYATNRLRPYAKVGGITRGLRITKNGKQPLLFSRGQVHMGASWNRYGEAGIDQRNDWINTLAHELGHYLFFLLDNYTGIDSTGQITEIRDCPGVMSNPYDEAISEFHPEQNWLVECEQTLAQVYQGRSDWATITAFYPALSAPNSAIDDPSRAGPPTLPFVVTRVDEVTATQSNTVAVADVTVVKADGAPYTASSQAHAFLLKDNETRVLDLGTPRRDQVKTWQAAPGDTLCIYDLAQPRPSSGQNPIATGNVNPTPSGTVKLFLPMIHNTHNRVSTNLQAVSGCTSLVTQTTEIKVTALADWQPDLVIVPQGAQTLSVTVRNLPAGLTLLVRHYPSDEPTGADTSAPITLTYDLVRQVYTGLLHTKRFAPEAYLRLYQADNPSRGVMVDYTLGGAPTLLLDSGVRIALGSGSTLDLDNGDARQVSGKVTSGQGSILVVHHTGVTLALGNGSTLELENGDTLELENGDTLALSNGSTLELENGDTLELENGDTLELENGDTLDLENGDALTLNTGEAPMRSSDGRMTFFVKNALAFGWGDYYTVQQAAILPEVPTYATPLGAGYRITASPGLTQPLSGSVTLHYFGRDIASSKESALRIYHWDEQTGWQLLPTTIDETHNSATAPGQGVGVYALLYSEQIPLVGPAWNNFAYPVHTPAPLPEAVASLDNHYTVIWGYNPADGSWRLFDPTLDPSNPFYDQINTLKALEFGHGYWIYMQESGILYLADSPSIVAAGAAGDDAVAASINHTLAPPALFYGPILTTANFTPTPGMTVTGWVNGQLCGQGVIQETGGGQLGYILAIAANSGGASASCGDKGAPVIFKVNDQPMITVGGWDNTNVQYVPLTTPNR